MEIDRSQIVQVFSNLLSNAGSYSPVGSEVVIYTEKKPNSVIVVIKDQGVGIPDNQKEEIFEKLFRADNITGLVSGSGLGLYVAKNIVEKHGGNIWFESVEGKGTTFFVELLIKQKNGL